MSLVLDPVIALGQHVAATASGRGFHAAIGDFTQLLATVPDSPPGATGDDDVAAVRAIAASVIEHIERRLEARTDRRPRQVALAQAVYQIQQALENIDRWHRHGSAPAASVPAR